KCGSCPYSRPAASTTADPQIGYLLLTYSTANDPLIGHVEPCCSCCRRAQRDRRDSKWPGSGSTANTAQLSRQLLWKDDHPTQATGLSGCARCPTNSANSTA